jgi:hypothetical protein
VSTHQYQSAKGILSERFGIVELSFQLEVREGHLVYRQVDATLRLGFIVVRLPRALQPKVYATERMSGNGDSAVHVTVEVRWPCSRLLVAYDGVMDVPPEHGV